MKQHIPVQIPSSDNKKYPTKVCKVCKSNGKRRETRYICQQSMTKEARIYNGRKEIQDGGVDKHLGCCRPQQFPKLQLKDRTSITQNNRKAG
ncbi:hypothetical protein QTO34_017404 [Cnephaeus nilssonii]|uniref:Uncharacterized protein n=1 Tax=Cnephaeus nilssonii TaxID=3371016 RepID=A0AA40I0Y3_CNENI|nr:hypothetical protein QTO34_017404 [Eptesicus nilssonii]